MWSVITHTWTSYPLINYHNYGKSQFFMGRPNISMAIFNIAMSVITREYFNHIHRLSIDNP